MHGPFEPACVLPILVSLPFLVIWTLSVIEPNILVWQNGIVLCGVMYLPMLRAQGPIHSAHAGEVHMGGASSPLPLARYAKRRLWGG